MQASAAFNHLDDLTAEYKGQLVNVSDQSCCRWPPTAQEVNILHHYLHVCCGQQTSQSSGSSSL